MSTEQTVRIALVAPIAPMRGGIAHHSESLVAAFGRLGHEVRVLSYRRQYPRLLFPGRSEWDPAAPAPGVPTARLLTALNPLASLAGARALRMFDPHLVVAAWWNAAVTLPVVAALAEARSRRRAGVVMAHNARSHDDGRLDALCWALLARVADGAVVHARVDADRLTTDHPALRVIASPHPPYDRFVRAQPSRVNARVALGVAPDAELAVVLGNVRPYKGVDVALRAISSLLETRPRLRLVVAGEIYPAARAAVEQALPSGSSARVALLDRYVSDDEMAQWTAAADVMLAPHLRASHSGVVQIARAAGLPVIAADVGGLRELVEDAPGGVLVTPGDPGALAAAVDQFFRESGPRSRSPTRGAILPTHEVEAAWEELARAVLRAGALSSGKKRQERP